MNIKNLLVTQKKNNKVAITQGNKHLSFENWYTLSSELHNFFLDNQVFGNVALCMNNSIEYAIAYFGITFLGETIVPLNPNMSNENLLSELKFCDVTYMLVDKSQSDQIQKWILQEKREIILIEVNVTEEMKIEIKKFEDNTFKERVNEVVQDKSVAILLPTSGTTSNSKRVMLTHENLLTNIKNNLPSLRANEKSVFLIALPMYFGYCNTSQFLTSLFLAARIVISESKFIAKNFFHITEKEKITHFTAVPTMLKMIIDYRYGNLYDISSLIQICFGGGPCKTEYIQNFCEYFGKDKIVQTYGQTEAGPRISFKTYTSGEIINKSVGVPIQNIEIKIEKETTTDFNGEILIMSDSSMKGYYKNIEETTKILSNGWLKTGDLGYLDDNGELHITGRKKNIIICGGISISCEFIEEVMLDFPGITETVAFSKKDELLGEQIGINYVSEYAVNEQELKKYFKNRTGLKNIKLWLEQVEQLKKTYNGKILRGG
ncbi:class I adenylate-forming enzyme family protein [Enterococcus termitis]|uniref:AMP-dependent synthetase/ligase domain-containing protein n=1 Tax=Enterococcus termitis TaxID=332950 RepID=A0A1E5GVN3_9ENTE|nr:class I adenylate-forming enzyme family protein [Enterococcus termitis]OEG16742.1 hypothetical protein BCR25_03855 [Enterococcus termitis]OJG99443.1 hypothetical protein RV18_GL001511 [Enterococcus termitis]